MAGFHMTGTGGVRRALAELSALAERAAPDMLEAACAVLVQAQRESVRRKGLIETGALLDSIRAGPLQETPDGWSREIWPQGRDRNGTENAVKGVLLEYGTAKRPPAAWMREANALAEERAAEAMGCVWAAYRRPLSLSKKWPRPLF